MTEQGQQDSTIRTLSSQLHDGILDPAAAAQLRSLLDKFPAGQDAYIDSVALHVLLVGAHEPALQSPSASELKALLPTSMPTGSVVSPGFDPNAGSVQTLHPGEQEHAPSGRRGSGTQAVPMKIGFVAAAAALLLTTGLWWNRSVSTTSEPFVAVLTDTAGVVWFADPPGAAPTRLESGRRIQLAEGLAELTFTSGAVVVVKGPADLELLSPMRVRAKRGAVRARVGSDAAGFVIETPTANVLDLGTEFGVDVNESGATD
ncbi:MAG TPA: hypothetical protein PKC18_10205, partial [Lacipirellulaceae bacterium]|nr:hypothetical protein [Lacipirellulaceae bacterium]